MKTHKQEHKPPEAKRPRFRIEKLEERIAPRRTCTRTGCYNYHYGHFNPHGKYVGAGQAN